MFSHEFFEFIEGHLGGAVGDGYWWEHPGECLMSGTDTLDEGCGVMVLGLNPGGGREGSGSHLPPLRAQVAEFRRRRPAQYSAYLDECWHYTSKPNGFDGWPQVTCRKCIDAERSGAPIRQQPHQKRVADVAEHLGLDLRRTVALNAIWAQAPDAGALATLARQSTHLRRATKKAAPTIRDLFKVVYLPALRELITGARIGCVICLGNGQRSAFHLLATTLGESADHTARTWTRPYRDGRFFDAGPLRVIGIPHPSFHTLSANGLRDIRAWYAEARTTGQRS
jgi:hypothetical protein